jgi:hypothetical protein
MRIDSIDGINIKPITATQTTKRRRSHIHNAYILNIKTEPAAFCSCGKQLKRIEWKMHDDNCCPVYLPCTCKDK